MINTNIDEHYNNFKNLYRDDIDIDVFAGCKPAADWVLVECIPNSATNISAGGIVMDHGRPRTPMVYKVHAVGPNVSFVKPDDLCLVAFQAGNMFSGSRVVWVQEKYIICNYGDGLRKPATPEVAPEEPVVPPGLARILGV
jgi:hypothetical protein